MDLRRLLSPPFVKNIFFTPLSVQNHLKLYSILLKLKPDYERQGPSLLDGKQVPDQVQATAHHEWPSSRYGELCATECNFWHSEVLEEQKQRADSAKTEKDKGNRV